MKKDEIRVGRLYEAKVNGRYTTVRVDDIRENSTHPYTVTNLSTGRQTMFRSAAKFRREIKGTAQPMYVQQMVDKAGEDEAERLADPLDQAIRKQEASEESHPTQVTPLQAGTTVETKEGEQSSDPTTETEVASTQEAIRSAATTQTVTEPTSAPCVGSSTASSQESAATATRSSLAAHIAATASAIPISKLTAEQEDILATAKRIEAAYSSGQRVMVIAAGAGTGKTFTLKQLEQVLCGNGQYTAFNASLVAESKAKFTRAACNTTHSLAFRAVGHRFKHRLNSNRMRSQELAYRLSIEDFYVHLPECIQPRDENGNPAIRRIKATYLAGQVMEAIKKFCMSAERSIGPKHFKTFTGLDEQGQWTNSNKVRDYLLPFAEKAWVDLQSEQGTLPFAHDHYVKIWQLGTGRDRPIIAADYILLDEAQDTAPVMLDILVQQTHTLIVLVGDDNQCQPVGTMVTVVKRPHHTGRHYSYLTVTEDVPIEAVQPGDTVVSYDVARSFLRRSGRKVTAISVSPFNGELVTVKTEENETSSYTPNHKCVVRVGDGLNGRWAVYLMRKGNSFRVGKVKGMYETQKGNIGLPMRMRAEEADAAWILETYDSESEAMLCESLIAWSWGIPTLRFKQSGAKGITQEGLDEFWTSIGNLTDKAARILTAFKRCIEFPLCTKDMVIYRNRGQIMQACNLMDGMLILTAKGAMDAGGKRAVKNKWSPITVGHQYYNGSVYSLKVEGDETYVADGIITHNSIYAWRGAVNAMAAFPGAPRRLLSQSFRFGQAVADVANAILVGLEQATDLIMRGLESIPTRVCEVEQPRCYIYRTNAGAIGRLMTELDSNRRGHLIGGSKETIAFCEAAIDLQQGRGTSHPELGCFTTWDEVVAYASEDEGQDLRLMVKLIKAFTAEKIVKALKGMPPEEQADFVVSTAHRTKGREWTTVQLGQDFPTADKLGDEERRLLYVASTRAQEELDLSKCPTFCGGYNRKEEDSEQMGDGGRFIPGIEVRYTTPMPTPEAIAAYRIGRTARNGHATANPPVPAAVPAAVPGPANGQARTAQTTQERVKRTGLPADPGYRWISYNGSWVIEGPPDEAFTRGKGVMVPSRAGVKEIFLYTILKRDGFKWVYGVDETKF